MKYKQSTLFFVSHKSLMDQNSRPKQKYITQYWQSIEKFNEQIRQELRFFIKYPTTPHMTNVSI